MERMIMNVFKITRIEIKSVPQLQVSANRRKKGNLQKTKTVMMKDWTRDQFRRKTRGMAQFLEQTQYQQGIANDIYQFPESQRSKPSSTSKPVIIA